MDRRRERNAVALAVGVGLALIAPLARADAPARVGLELAACDAFDGAELTRLLRIELAADGVGEVAAGGGDAIARIHVGAAPCSPAAREVTVTIDDSATGKSVRRVISTADIPAASRARALALAIAELLRASWTELALPEAPPPNVQVPAEVLRAVKLRAAPAPVEPTPAPAPMRTTVDASVEARLFPARQSVVMGPSLGGSVPLGDLPLRVRADAYAGFGRGDDPLGSIALTLLTGDVGLMLAGGPEAVRVELGPVVALGRGSATGNPTAGNLGASGEGLVVTGQLASRCAVRIARAWWSVLRLDAGAVLRPFEAQASNRTASGFGGPLLGAGIGIGREL